MDIIVLAGPTASGKSALAMALANAMLSRGEQVEFVSVDSAQVYRGMDIGTAKPSPIELSTIPHHLINVINPDESYSAGRFREECLQAITSIIARGAHPILVGGTMLYFKVLLEGIHDLPSAPAHVRDNIEARANDLGWERLHQELTHVDPEIALAIKPNDRQRISRALELIAVGTLPSVALKAQKETTHDAFPFQYRTIYLYPQSREALRHAIRERWMAMWKAGLIEEIKQLRIDFSLSENLPSMRCVGYRQVWKYLESLKTSTPQTLATLHEQAVIATSQLAKRQLTWIRAFIDKSITSGRQAETFILDSSAMNESQRFQSTWDWLQQH